MKYAIVILGGAADQPQPELGGRTPLEAVDAPALADVAAVGRLGEALFVPSETVPPVPPGPDAAMLSLLGYRPELRYPGHAPLHALGAGLPLAEGDWCFELSLLSVIDGVAQPASAIHVPAGEAETLIRGLLDHVDLRGASVYPGQTTRSGSPVFLMIDPQAVTPPRDWSEVVSRRPDDIVGEPLRKAMPVGGQAGERLQQFIEAGHAYLASHELNRARADMGEPLTTHLWPWGQGTRSPGVRPMKRWAERFGMSAVVISRDPAVRGVAKLAGIDAIHPDPTDNNGAHANDPGDDTGAWQRLGARAVEAMPRYDLTIIHDDSAQRASLDAGPRDKVGAIERASERLLGRVHRSLSNADTPYRLLVTPLHATHLNARRESAGPVPFLVAGHKISNVVPRPLTETAATLADLRVPFGHELMEFFLKGGIR